MSSIADLVTSTAQGMGVDPSLALEVAIAESNLDQGAISSTGAIGVMQLEPATARSLGVDPTDLKQNIQGGVLYLGQLLGQFGDPAKALAAYNAGPTRVAKAIATGGANWLGLLPSETRNYVAKIMNALATQWTVSPSPPVAAALQVASTVQDVADQAGVSVSDLTAAAGMVDWSTLAPLIVIGILGLIFLHRTVAEA